MKNDLASAAATVARPWRGVAAARSRWTGQWPRLKQWTLRLAEFGLVQGLVQILTAVSGLLIVRTLSKHDYALFAIANSMQMTGSLLADLGIGIGLRSIGGRVWNDRERFGQLLNTAFGLRRRFALVSLAVTVPVAGWMLWRNGASVPLGAGLCLSIAAGVIPLLGSSVFATSLQLHAEYRRMQHLDFGNALLRLLLIAGLTATRINALLASVVGVVGNWVQFIFARSWARDLANPTAPPNVEDRRELLRLSLKALPNTIFFCFQGQLTLLILTFVGNPAGIADVTAIGRITALFAVSSAVFSSVLAPRFARCQDLARLPRLYFLLVGAILLVLAPLLLLAWLLPGPLLWLLGSKYAALEKECVWIMAAGCVGQVAGVMWNLNSSRAWIRFLMPLFIPVWLGTQVVSALFLDFRDFHQVLIFNLISAGTLIPVYLLDAFFGFRGRIADQQKTSPP